MQSIKNFLSTKLAAKKKQQEQVQEQVQEQDSWPDPVEIKKHHTIVDLFTKEYLPSCIQEFVFSTAKRLNNAPVEFVAVSCLVSAASLIGGSAVIQPKREDTAWILIPTLWGALVGGPSVMKTPAMEAGVSLIPKMDKAENDVKRTIVVNDVTPESLAINLASNPNGIMLSRDELAGWLINLDKEERAAERAFYLQAFNGSGSFVQDRVSRDRIEVEPLIVSVLGGIQPSLLMPLLTARNEGRSNDGLFERMQLMVFPDYKPQYVDIAPDQVVQTKTKSIFSFLSTFSENNHKKRFTFNDEAHDLWREYAQKTICRGHSSEDGLIQGLLGKYPALCAKLALIFHLMSQTDHDKVIFIIDAEHVRRSILWMSLLESHYQRLMHFTSNVNIDKATNALIEKLRHLPEIFAKRDLARKSWKNLGTEKEREIALERLVEHGYLRISKVSPNNRTKTLYTIHPSFRG
jgi:hypothetical protein